MHDVANPLIPLSALRERSMLVRRSTDAALPAHRDLAPEGEEALRYHLLFSDDAAVAACGFARMTEAQRFYNRYYWFKRFAQQYAAAYGEDAGIEQQAFQLLEHAPPDVDWAIVEQIEKLLLTAAS